VHGRSRRQRQESRKKAVFRDGTEREKRSGRLSMKGFNMKQLLTALLVLSLAVFAGCSEDQGDVVDTCLAHCEHVGAAVNCPDTVANEDVAECKAACQPYVSSLDADCQVALEDFYLCSMSAYTYQCDEGSDMAYAEIVGDDDPCEEEGAAWGACMFGM
jgi:hypothetical protein